MDRRYSTITWRLGLWWLVRCWLKNTSTGESSSGGFSGVFRLGAMVTYSQITRKLAARASVGTSRACRGRKVQRCKSTLTDDESGAIHMWRAATVPAVFRTVLQYL